MRLIDADALTKQLEEMAENEWNKTVGSSKGLEDAIDVIETMPTVERPHGEWLTQWKDTCSQCKKEFDVPTGDNGKALWNYCPNCGADMREGDEE